ncbi:cbb3-type cytochrome oxidase assembly protein CcoS [Gracilimonas mengyeensis]|uniref:Cytochrome oxidase maturation protein, cbb3-type n=1 Tax=Gracilimonas mengyeensis TaxID=1302730 RepID=A0A521BE20_9BACT|nr:cbb3-type cytochrome oxidase assembly protein CcoS [Gracilimonas mengyeensis]SMO45358.1 cytochrome oxidase maturation protein, cbb3-type [Gracilimonas mengyeensis]
MEVMYLLIGFSLMVALIFLGLFFWAVKSGQFDDQYTPSMRVLFDDKKASKKESNNNQKHRDE